MAKKNLKQKRAHTEAMVDLRRSLVAAVLCRVPNVSIRGIAKILGEGNGPGHISPKTKRPWTPGTIHGDVVAIRALWRESMEADAEEWKAKVIAGQQEIVGEAHRAGELGNARLSWAEICKMLGLYQPERVEVEQRSVVQVIGGMDPDEDF